MVFTVCMVMIVHMQTIPMRMLMVVIVQRKGRGAFRNWLHLTTAAGVTLALLAGYAVHFEQLAQFLTRRIRVTRALSLAVSGCRIFFLCGGFLLCRGRFRVLCGHAL